MRVIKQLEKLMKKTNMDKFKEMNFHEFEKLIPDDEEENEGLIETERRGQTGRISSMEKINKTPVIGHFSTIKDKDLR